MQDKDGKVFNNVFQQIFAVGRLQIDSASIMTCKQKLFPDGTNPHIS